jgi:hypothetical protein
MGVEGLVPLLLWVGCLLFVVLLWLSFPARSRPYALPTLVAAMALGAFLSSRDSHAAGYLWSSLVAWFGLGAIIFGAHAYAIRLLLKRRSARAAS